MKARKNCPRCKQKKKLEDFYKSKGTLNGFTVYCKDCIRQEMRDKYTLNIKDEQYILKERERGRNRYYKFLHKKRESKKSLKYNSVRKRKYPEKHKCGYTLHNYFVRNNIKVPKDIHMHHWSYKIEDALDVIPLHQKYHNFFHKYIKYDTETFLYKDLLGNLLDTKEKHLNYFYSLKPQIDKELEKAQEIRTNYLKTLKNIKCQQ